MRVYGICYTQSGDVKKYEPGGLNRPDQVKWITGYTVGYPSTAYYPGILCDNFYLFTYDNFPPGMDKDFPDFTEGSAIYFFSPRITTMPSDLEPNNNSYISYNRIYNLMSYTPPAGYVLDENGPYTYIATATVYSYNDVVEYYTAINTLNIGADTIEKEFRYKKADKPDKFINYYVTLTLNSGMLNCKCNRVTGIPGTNNGNVTLAVRIQLGDGKAAIVGGRDEWFQFSWVMKNGIDESKSCSVPYYLGSGFTTQESWEIDNGDGTKTYYTFHINRSSIPDPPHS